MATVYFRPVSPSEAPKAAAHALLEQVLQISPEALIYDPAGKPHLSGGPEFSLSHTRGGAVLAVDQAPVGVDAELIRPISPSLPKRTLSQREYAWFIARGARPEDFFTLWTLKESYYKFLGTGLPGIPNQTAFCLHKDRWQLPGAPCRFDTWGKNLLRIALCSHAQQVEFVTISEN